LVFPDGIRYNRKKDESRTESVNSVFFYIAQLARVLGKEKSEHKDRNISVSAFVETIAQISNFFEEDLKLFEPI
jgi:hypothetical protein